MATNNLSFRFDLAGLLQGMADFQQQADAAIRKNVSDGAQLMEKYAKEHRKWRDHTTDARRRFTGRYEASATGYKIIIAHGVDYGKWLELAHEKRYAIIPETLQICGAQKVMPAFQNLINRLHARR